MMSETEGVKLAALSNRTDQSGFDEALLEALTGQLNKLPLERFCTRGGWPLDVSIARIKFVYEDAAKLEALLFVSFTETGAACCSGDVFEHQHFSELLLRIDKADWFGSFPISD